MIRPLLVNESDILGGAAIAAYRLHKALRLNDIESRMLAQHKYSDDFTVINSESILQKGLAKIRPILDISPHVLYKRRKKSVFSLQWLPSNVHQRINQLNPDVVNLHWICGGFIPIESIAKIKAPLVWTLHDMWPLTGGCHYTGGCEGYLKCCGTCPQLNSHHPWDLSRWTWWRKSKAWNRLDITIIVLSNWLAECAQKSSLFKDKAIKIIPNGIDSTIYRPTPKNTARNLLNLPTHKKLILFGAMNPTSDPRKGFQFLSPALEELSLRNSQNDFELVVFGSSQPAQGTHLPFKTNYMGRLNDDVCLALLYSAVDVFVAPSTEDNLPNTVMEALACGTPSVAFNIGGMPDMIRHQVNGYLAQPFDTSDLAHGIFWILQDEHRHQKLSENARNTIEENFTIQTQAKKYLSAYQDAINQRYKI